MIKEGKCPAGMNPANKRVVFDSYAILELLEDGPGARMVADLLADSGERVQIYLSEISLGEVYYILLRRHGVKAAEEVVEYIQLEESLSLATADWQRIKKAAEYKAEGGLSYADCFVPALAFDEEAAIVTGDPEIIKAAEVNELAVIAI